MLLWGLVALVPGGSRAELSTATRGPESELRLVPLPSLVTGTLSPFSLAVDGIELPVEVSAVARLELDGAVVSAQPERPQPFFAQAKSETLKIEVFRKDGQRLISTTVALPKVDSAVVVQASNTFNEVVFALPEITALQVDGKKLPITSGLSRWRFSPTETMFGWTHTVQVQGTGGRERVYNFSWSSVSDPRREPKIRWTWVDASGKSAGLNWKTASRWVWRDDRMPVLRTWVQLPDGVKVTQVSSTSFSRALDRGENPFSGKPTLTLDTVQKSGQAKVDFKDAHGKAYSYTAFYRAVIYDPVILVHEQCADRRIDLRESQKGGTHFFIGIACAEQDGVTELVVSHSGDTEVKGTESGRTSDAFREIYRVRSLREGRGTERQLLAFRAEEKGSGKASRYELFAKLPPKSHPWLFKFQAGPTSLHYQEDPQNARVSEWALMLRAGATYRAAERWDFTAMGYATPLVLTHSSSDTGTLKFFGLDFQAGYRLPWRLKGVELRPYGGVQVWRLAASDRSFGLNYLIGPELGLSAAGRFFGQRDIRGYLAYTPVSRRPFSGLSLSSRKLAVGLSVELSDPYRSATQWMLISEYATTAFSVPDAQNRISMQTWFFGIELGI